MIIKKPFKIPEFAFHLSEVKGYYMKHYQVARVFCLSRACNHKFQNVIPKKYLPKVRKYTDKHFQHF